MQLFNDDLTETSFIGRYRMIEKLGAGAMGVVFKCHDAELDRDVAVKTIIIPRDVLSQEDEQRLRTFSMEARIAAILSHPNITAIYDIGSHQDTRYFVMEYVEGTSLLDLVRSGEAMGLDDKLRLVSSIARAMNYAHKRKVVHRDIKPANIMISAAGEPKIMDFGIAKLHGGSLIGIDEMNAMFGSPQYMSPEQIRGGDVGPASDIFSLGVTTYEFVTGRRPFSGDSLENILMAVLSADPPPPSVLDPNIPKELDEIVMKAMEKDPERRFGNAGAFSDAVELLINKLERTSEANRQKAMANKQVIHWLKSQYLLFSDFEDEEIVEIFKLAGRESYKAGDVIFKEGTAGNRMFVIVEGAVQIIKGAPSGDESVEMVTLRPGGCFGEMAIIDGSPRSATAMAAEDVALISINEAVLRIKNPELCVKLYKNLASIIADNLRKTSEMVYRKTAKKAGG
ncbi:MAG: protein kinase [Nitrospinae bacterium]|nr:protein kinase [Nitrospinota bacterium]